MKFTGILLLGVFACFGFELFGNEINFEYYQKKYADENSIILNKRIVVSYYIDKSTGELIAKSKHYIERLFLDDNPEDNYLIQIPFNTFQELQLTNGRLFEIDSLGDLQLRENIKVKYAEVKDYFIEGIFYNDLKVKQFSPKLSVKEKNVLKYTYEYTYNDLKFLNAFNVNDNNENVENFELVINYPNVVDVAVNQFYISESKLDFREIKRDNSTELLYSLSNITFPERNQLSPSPNYYLPHFIVQTKSYTCNGVKKKVLESTDDLYNWYHSLINQLNTDDAKIRNLTNSIIAHKNTDKEKIDTLYKWCQKKIQYVAFEDGIAGFKPEDAQNVLKNRYGDCKGIANLLVEMLRCAGFNANHAWIGTRYLPYNYSLPSIVVDNHMICTLEFGEQTYYLDATNKITKWDTPSAHIQGKQVLVENEDQYKISEIPVDESSRNKTIIEFEGQIENNKLIVMGNLTLLGMPDYEFKSFLQANDNNTKKSAYTILLEHYLKNFVPVPDVNIHIQDYNNDNLKVKINGYFAGCCLKNEKEIFLFPSFDKKFKHVELEKLETPISFNFNEEFSLIAKIKLPANSIVTTPKSHEYSTPDKKLVEKISYTINNNVLVIRKDIVIKTLLLDNNKIKYWVDFTKNLLETSATPVIIKF